MTAGRTNHALFAAAPTQPPAPDRSRFITGNETPKRQPLTCPMCDTVFMAPPRVYLCDHCRVMYGAAP